MTNELPISLKQLVTPEQAWHYHIVPKEEVNGSITFLVDETRDNGEIADELEMLLGKTVHLEACPSTELKESLGKHYRREHQVTDARAQQFSVSDDFLTNLIHEAKSVGSSDIHIEVYEQTCRVRVRIDGVMVERYLVDKLEYPGLVNKIKIKAHLDISEKRLPQDGRIFFQEGNQKFDIRVSVLPTLYGEKVVMRLLSNDATNVNIEKVGFSKADLENYLEGVKKPNGIILISGPTGSGKTTTLYATLKLLNKKTTNVLTIEDPIEYTLEGINQVQLKEDIGLDFASALRTFLRQDPDVIMVGEIRDRATAQMAIRASLTGHLVLSTLHTNSAWGSVSRLIDMDVPAYLLASTLNTTVAQRLVRLLCPSCKEQKPLNAVQYPKNFKAPREMDKHFVAKGCGECYYTGYKGRKAIFEVIPIDYELEEKIREQQYQVDGLLKEKDIFTLAENAFNLFEAGETSLEEVYPILSNAME